MVPQPFAVLRNVRESHDTFTLELEPAAGSTELNFRAGQFNMLYVFGVGEIPISISGDSARPQRLVHTTREVGVVTRALRRVRRGGCIGVRGPFGQPWPLEAALGRDVILVAGGLGIAPLRSAVYGIMARRDSYGRVLLLYGTRAPQDLLFRREIERWRAVGHMDIEVTVDHADGPWPGHVGVVTSRIAHATFDADRAIAMVCGPEIMMRFAAAALASRGVPIGSIYLSLERNMKCAIGLCGHCQLGPAFVCKDGPVLAYARVKDLLSVREM